MSAGRPAGNSAAGSVVVCQVGKFPALSVVVGPGRVSSMVRYLY
jgi:hypothetical protein